MISHSKIKLFMTLLLLIFPITLVSPLEINVTYDLNSNTLEKGRILTFNQINITSDQNVNITFKIKLDNYEVFKKDLNLNANVPKVLNGLSFNVNDFYKKYHLLIYDKNGNLLKDVNGDLYVYYLNSKKCKLDDYIIEEDDDTELSIKFKDENEDLDKILEIYLDNDLEKDYEFDDEIEKDLSVDMDELYKKVSCKIKIKGNNKYIYSKELPVLIYDIDKLTFDFDEYDKLEVKTDDFDLSNKQNKIELKISIGDYDYEFEWYNKTSVSDFTIDLFNNDEIKDDEDKIDLIKDLLEDFTSDDGIEINYDLTLYLYNNSREIDHKDVFSDETYYVKDFPEDKSVEFSGKNDFKLEVLDYNQTIEQFSYFTGKVLVKAKEGNDFDVKVCMAIEGNSYCKTVTLDEDDDEDEEKVVELSKYIEKTGNYKVVFYAYDEDDSKIIWKTKEFNVKSVKGINLEILNQVLVGFKGETKTLKVQVENPSNSNLNVNLIVRCGDEVNTKKVSLKAGERKIVEIPIKLSEECNGKVEANVKTLNNENTFSIIIKEKNNEKNAEEKETKGTSKKFEETEKEENVCFVREDLIYSKKDNLSFKIIANNGSEINIEYNDEVITVVPSNFVSKGENIVTVIRKTDDVIMDNLRITCKKDGEKKTTEVTVYFYKKEKPWYKDTSKVILASAITSAVLILIIAFLLFI